MSVAVWAGSLVAWERELAALKERIGPVFGRAETRATAGAFLDGLLSGVARKTGWLLAEQAWHVAQSARRMPQSPNAPDPNNVPPPKN